MKKILLITSLLFISCVYAQSKSFKTEKRIKSFKTEKRIKSFQSEKRVQNQQELPNLILDSISIAYFSDEGGFEKYIAKFDANGNETISINLLWDETSADFLPNFLEEYTYDSDGNLTLSTHYLWDDIAADFLQNSSEEYTYDANGNEIEVITYEFDPVTDAFLIAFKSVTTYDFENYSSSTMYYSYNSEISFYVLSSYLSIATFDANGNQTLFADYNFDDVSQSLVPISKEEYTYDTDGNLTLFEDFGFDIESEFLLPISIREYTYDANGNQTLFESYYWNEQGLLVSNRKEQDNYDDNGLLLSKIYFLNSDPVSGELIPDTKWEFTTELDTNIQLHRMGIPYDYNTDVDDWEEVELESAKSYVFYTKTATLSLETLENDLISLYPNPTSEQLYLSHPELNSFEIQIVDLNGKQMYSGTMKKDVPLDVSTYTSGMYLVTIENAATKKKNIYKIIKK